jgi:hypothetical protein
VCYSLWYNTPTMLPAGSLEAEFSSGICHTGLLTACEQEHLLLLTSCQQTVMSLSTGAPDGHLQRVTVPDAVLTQFDLMMMSMTFLETCRGL